MKAESEAGFADIIILPTVKGNPDLLLPVGCCCCLVTQSPTLVTPWTVACQASLSTGFSRQEYWSGVPFPSPGDLPHPGIKPRSPALQADSLTTEIWGKPSLHIIAYTPIQNKKFFLKKNNMVWNILLLQLSGRKVVSDTPSNYWRPLMKFKITWYSCNEK